MKIEIDFSLTESAVLELRKVIDEGSVLRVSAKSSGCSGVVYGLGVEKPEDSEASDLIEDFEGLKFVMDKSSAMLLDGVVLDWCDSESAKGFRFTNSKSSSGCCRKSGGCQN